MFNERRKCTDVTVLLCKTSLRGCKCFFLLVVLNAQEFVVVRVDVWRLVADDRLHVLIFCLLLDVLEFEMRAALSAALAEHDHSSRGKTDEELLESGEIQEVDMQGQADAIRTVFSDPTNFNVKVSIDVSLSVKI